MLPDFLSVVFDPTKRKIGGIDLNGWYDYDDEGVKARPVTAVENGVAQDVPDVALAHQRRSIIRTATAAVSRVSKWSRGSRT